MIRIIFFIVILPAVFFSCGQSTRDNHQDTDDMIIRVEALESSLSQTEIAFLDNLASLCGKSFRGEETYMAPGRESWAEKDFLMHVTVCEDDRVYIPFHLDEDQSRIWMFIAEDRGLRFRHDHRHEDGTPEDLTMYGGYADGKGNEYRQHFPADDYTIELLEDTLGREWRGILSEDLSSFTYQLLYNSDLVFEAEFDLTDPV